MSIVMGIGSIVFMCTSILVGAALALKHEKHTNKHFFN